MSTRSNIAIEDPKTKKVKVIYVHSDGYPYGVGKCLVDNYNKRDVAELLFNHGDASYLGDTLDECSFYGRDWERQEEPAKTYRDEWMYMYNMRGDCHIEYIYLFKDNRWHVSTSQYIKEEKLKNSYDGGIWYHSKFEPVIMNKEYIKYKDKHEKHAEVKMVAQIGKLLSENFGADQVMVQGADTKKKSN
jgi:hypothetical protein|tara:strand:+ start:587 stop:1153 length:567 start_codon:yes stop_codon:yes gene_type:complete